MSHDALDPPMDGAPSGAWQRRLASAAALVAAVLLIALVVLVAISNTERDKALLRERHSYDVMLVTRQLDASIARAEAALGRFVISGEKHTGALYYDEWKKAGAATAPARRADPRQPRPGAARGGTRPALRAARQGAGGAGDAVLLQAGLDGAVAVLPRRQGEQHRADRYADGADRDQRAQPARHAIGTARR